MTTTKRKVAVWLVFIYLTCLGALQLIGASRALHKAQADFTLLQYYLLYLPVLLRIGTGVLFMARHWSATPASIATVLAVVSLPFYMGPLLGGQWSGFQAVLQVLPTYYFFDWALLFFICLFAIRMSITGSWKSGPTIASSRPSANAAGG